MFSLLPSLWSLIDESWRRGQWSILTSERLPTRAERSCVTWPRCVAACSYTHTSTDGNRQQIHETSHNKHATSHAKLLYTVAYPEFFWMGGGSNPFSSALLPSLSSSSPLTHFVESGYILEHERSHGGFNPHQPLNMSLVVYHQCTNMQLQAPRSPRSTVLVEFSWNW